MASVLPRRAAEFDTGKKSNAFASLGQFFSGGASGVAKKLGGMASRGITAYTGAATRGAASAGSAFGRGLAGLGTTSGRGNTFTKVIPGNPQAQPQQQVRGGPKRV